MCQQLAAPAARLLTVAAIVARDAGVVARLGALLRHVANYHIVSSLETSSALDLRSSQLRH